MKKSANNSLLNDETISVDEKLKLSLYIKKESIIKANTLIALTDSSSRNDVIEKAVDFYFGYITSQLSQDYLCSVFGQKIEGLVGSLGTRVSRGNFRYAVELDVLSKMLASVLHMTGEQYKKLRKKSIDEVKRTNGSIDFIKAMNETEENLLP